MPGQPPLPPFPAFEIEYLGAFVQLHDFRCGAGVEQAVMVQGLVPLAVRWAMVLPVVGGVGHSGHHHVSALFMHQVLDEMAVALHGHSEHAPGQENMGGERQQGKGALLALLARFASLHCEGSHWSTQQSGIKSSFQGKQDVPVCLDRCWKWPCQRFGKTGF